MPIKCQRTLDRGHVGFSPPAYSDGETRKNLDAPTTAAD